MKTDTKYIGKDYLQKFILEINVVEALTIFKALSLLGLNEDVPEDDKRIALRIRSDFFTALGEENEK